VARVVAKEEVEIRRSGDPTRDLGTESQSPTTTNDNSSSTSRSSVSPRITIDSAKLSVAMDARARSDANSDSLAGSGDSEGVAPNMNTRSRNGTRQKMNRVSTYILSACHGLELCYYLLVLGWLKVLCSRAVARVLREVLN
jgi:hypothetical protein